MKAYIDESGHESQGHVFLAGHIGTEDQWTSFEPEWKKALGKKTRFHMVQLRWDKPYTNELLARLGPVPTRCGLTRVLGGVKVSDYEDLVSGTDAQKFLKGYYTALEALVINALRWIPKGERLEIILEEQSEYKQNTSMMLSALCSLPHDFLWTQDRRPKLAKWGFVSKETIRMHQADYLVYGLLQLYRDKNSCKTHWCRPIFGNYTGIGAIMTRAQVRQSILVTEQLLGGWNMQ